MTRVALLVSGLKGEFLLDACLQHFEVVGVCHQDVRGTLDDSNTQIPRKIKNHQVESLDVEEVFRQANGFEFILAAGWKRLILNAPKNFIICHDSLLPQYRGFCPTVTALIDGAEEIGVTAFFAEGGVDTGPIISQHSCRIHPFITIREAYEKQRTSYEAIVKEIAAESLETHQKNAKAQDSDQASYALWRDDADYWIDWTRDSETICRQINASGWPYQGARTHVENDIVLVYEAAVGEDLEIADRRPGKILRINGTKALVVCGRGTLQIKRACKQGRTEDYRFQKLRSRLH